MVPVTRTRSLQRAATVFGESPVGGSGDGDGVCPGRDVRARGLFRRFVCVFVVCSKCVRARGWLLRSACLSGFRCACMCLSVSEGSVCTCAACLEGVRLYRVCSGGLGAVPVFPRDWVCTVVGPRLRSFALDSASDWCLRESTCVGVCVCVCVCGRPGAALRCFPLVSVWLRKDTRWLIPQLPANRSVRRCLF